MDPSLATKEVSVTIGEVSIVREDPTIMLRDFALELALIQSRIDSGNLRVAESRLNYIRGAIDTASRTGADLALKVCIKQVKALQEELDMLHHATVVKYALANINVADKKLAHEDYLIAEGNVRLASYTWLWLQKEINAIPAPEPAIARYLIHLKERLETQREQIRRASQQRLLRTEAFRRDNSV